MAKTLNFTLVEGTAPSRRQLGKILHNSNSAILSLRLAVIYAEDGGYHSAALKAEEAAKLFRQAAQLKDVAMGLKP